MTGRANAWECASAGHAPPLVEHLPEWRTRITCPRCGRTVIETGLADHPDAKGKGPSDAR